MTLAIDARDLAPGFAEPVFDSQSAFRAIMNAIAYPGRIERFRRPVAAPAGLSPAAATIALTLCDFETPLWLDESAATEAAVAYLRFHSGAPIVDHAGRARFCIIGGAASALPLHAFHAGEDKYPDRSATLIIEAQSLTSGAPRRWRGPGIKGERVVGVGGMKDSFWDEWTLNQTLYPLGVDVFFACGEEIVGLPRGVATEA